MIAIDTVVAAIEAHLEAAAAQTVTVGNAGVSRFNQVIQGPLYRPEGDRIAAFWIASVVDEKNSLDTFATTYTFTVGLHWKIRPLPSDQSRIEQERIDSLRAVLNRFWGDCSLGGSVSDIDLGPVNHAITQYVEPTNSTGSVPYLSFMFDLVITDLNGGSIAP